MGARLKPAQHAARLELYLTGARDCEIARAEGIAHCAIRQWRIRHGLPPHHTRTSKIKDDRRVTLLNQGYSLRHIARIEGFKGNALAGWARRRGAISAHEAFSDREKHQRPVFVSIDAPIFDSNFHELIPDPRWSPWLEAMGATVWE